jgi:catechol 2,3-dioxygenase-like lactoylglutathione lyase family enzyme
MKTPKASSAATAPGGASTPLAGSPIIGFIPTSDFERARAFYGDKLGLQLTAEDAFALVFEHAGTMVRIVKVGKFQPAAFTILGWKVAEIGQAVAGLTARGIVFERYAHMPQDAQGIWNAPGGARVAWFKDGDGNVLSLSQHP